MPDGCDITRTNDCAPTYDALAAAGQLWKCPTGAPTANTCAATAAAAEPSSASQTASHTSNHPPSSASESKAEPQSTSTPTSASKSTSTSTSKSDASSSSCATAACVPGVGQSPMCSGLNAASPCCCPKDGCHVEPQFNWIIGACFLCGSERRVHMLARHVHSTAHVPIIFKQGVLVSFYLPALQSMHVRCAACLCS